ncbi:MAG: hypothetical protein IRZ03_08260 [Acidobacterium ailaaui]|nr:hypothetical protein [Pseudacidobacterium ailaaui]
MKKTIAAIAAAAVLATGCKTPDQPTPVPASSSHQPLEDEPGWDCHTMGNRQCGPEDPRA